ncbi:MAG: hypothetical protein HFI12_04775 [Lachnospiraceae bacterium]|jgi:flagellar hook-length control protein FliK|nr:hypothetical protein [Lachnospiraceae bacterium]
MAKIANVQLPVNPVGNALPVQSAKDTQGSSDFLAMLKQKGETPEQPEGTDKAKEPVEKPETKEPEKQPQDDEASMDGLKEAQAALEQLAAQLTVVTPEVPSEPVVTPVEAPVTEAVEAVLPEAVPEGFTETILPEAVAAQPEVMTKVTEDVKPEAPKMPVEPKKDSEASQRPTKPVQESTQAPKETEPVRTVESKASTETVQEEVRELPKWQTQTYTEDVTSTASTASADGQEAAPQVAMQHPVTQTERTFEGEKVKSADFKSTIEELPQQLGKALSSGKLTGNRTLTVELEPASLGKLTIKLSYEAGRTAVSILASNPKSLEILNQKASEIAAILKEHTGEETVIYTQEPQQQEENSYDGHQGSQNQEQKGHSRHDEDKEQQADSFAQQLRLGLV